MQQPDTRAPGVPDRYLSLIQRQRRERRQRVWRPVRNTLPNPAHLRGAGLHPTSAVLQLPLRLGISRMHSTQKRTKLGDNSPAGGSLISGDYLWLWYKPRSGSSENLEKWTPDPSPALSRQSWHLFRTLRHSCYRVPPTHSPVSPGSLSLSCTSCTGGTD